MKTRHFEVRLVTRDPRLPRRLLERNNIPEQIESLFWSSMGLDGTQHDFLTYYGREIVMQTNLTAEAIEDTGGLSRAPVKLKTFAKAVTTLIPSITEVNIYGYSKDPREQQSVCLWYWTYHTSTDIMCSFDLPDKLQQQLAKDELNPGDPSRFILDYLFKEHLARDDDEE